MKSSNVVTNYLKEAYRLGPRQYDDSCPVGAALNLVGDRWTLSLMKELQFGDRRFSDLRDSLPGLSARALSLRLSHLEERNLVTRVRHPSGGSINAYRSTEQGLGIRKFIIELVRWGIACGLFDPAASKSSSSLAMSLLASFQCNDELPRTARIRLVSPKLNLALRISDGTAAITTDDHHAWDAEVTGPVTMLAGYLFGRSSLQQSLRQKPFKCGGDMDLIERLPSWFVRPADPPRLA